MNSIAYLKNKYPIQTGLSNPGLRQKSKKIEKIDKDIQQFASDLLDLMWEYDGVGLAAPQIGENIRMIAITRWKGSGSKQKLVDEKVMINPEIVEYSKDTSVDQEGCLSLPNQYANVSRSNSIVVKYQDIKGQVYTETLTGFNARIVQHEYDHLEGILFMDKAIDGSKGGSVLQQLLG